MRKTLILAVLMMTAICLTAQQGPPQPSPVNGSGVTLLDGLKYWNLKVGTGALASKGYKVTVHYTGWLLEDGSVFDSSYSRQKPLEFTLGAGEVIQGWDEGLIGMRVGGKRQLRVPPDLGYGWHGAPPHIPGNAYLIFEVELLDVK